jgi:hypothetical protein
VRLALDDSRDTYLLTYSPKGLVRDGSSHSIRVASTRPGLRLRYRRGYFAPRVRRRQHRVLPALHDAVSAVLRLVGPNNQPLIVAE